MDWEGLRDDVDKGKTSNYGRLPAYELDELARLALAGKALAEAVRQVAESYGIEDGVHPCDPPTLNAVGRELGGALAAWDAAEKGER